MEEFVIQTIEQGGYIGIALLMALENIFPPIPSELIMGIGGISVARGNMEFWPLLLAGTIGSTFGNYVWYLAGDRWGAHRLAPFIRRWGRWLTVEWRDIQLARRFFRRHGPWVVFFMRFSPFLRTMVSLPAGLARMGHWRFLIFTFGGTAVWNVLMIQGGKLLAFYLDEMGDWLNWGVIALIVIALATYIHRVMTWRPRAERDR
jgi:membrane protein DedA with SNARE-associated domain